MSISIRWPRLSLALLSALALGTSVGAGLSSGSVPSVAAAPLTITVDGPNVACTALLQDTLAALSGNPNPAEEILVSGGNLTVTRLVYSADVDALVYDLPGVPLDAAGTIVMLDRNAVGAHGYTGYWCDESHVMQSTYIEPGDGSYPDDGVEEGASNASSADAIMGCDSTNTSICGYVGPIISGVAGLPACTAGKVINLANNTCEALKALIRFVRNRWNRGPDPDTFNCPLSVACDAVTNACAVKKWACNLLKIKNVCWKDLGC